jgi:small subunit ribosomal protein S4
VIVLGYPGKNRKTYSTPSHPWDIIRISKEPELVKNYGLRNRRELWKVESRIRNYRRVSRKLLATPEILNDTSTHQYRVANDILTRMRKLGVLPVESKLDDVLMIKNEDFLERRLQTQVLRKGLAKSIKEARQRIVHGHIAIAGKKVTIPSYLVSLEEESLLGFYQGSSLKDRVEETKPEPKPQQADKGEQTNEVKADV